MITDPSPVLAWIRTQECATAHRARFEPSHEFAPEDHAPTNLLGYVLQSHLDEEAYERHAAEVCKERAVHGPASGGAARTRAVHVAADILCTPRETLARLLTDRAWKNPLDGRLPGANDVLRLIDWSMRHGPPRHWPTPPWRAHRHPIREGTAWRDAVQAHHASSVAIVELAKRIHADRRNRRPFAIDRPRGPVWQLAQGWRTLVDDVAHDDVVGATPYLDWSATRAALDASAGADTLHDLLWQETPRGTLEGPLLRAATECAAETHGLIDHDT